PMSFHILSCQALVKANHHGFIVEETVKKAEDAAAKLIKKMPKPQHLIEKMAKPNSIAEFSDGAALLAKENVQKPVKE
ncbi:hypothetical protein PMAYCL1PPCAC_10795, partial [Pristionchus mayeri]